MNENVSLGRIFGVRVDGGRLVGIVSPSDINALLQRSLSGRAPARA